MGLTWSPLLLLLLLLLPAVECGGPRRGWFSFVLGHARNPSSIWDSAPDSVTRVGASPPPNAAHINTPSMTLTAESVDAQKQSRALWESLESKGQLSACWKRSLEALRRECGAINANDALRSRLALSLAACDSEEDGRTETAALRCAKSGGGDVTAVRHCVRGLSETAYALFVQYRLHTDVLCAYLQEELFHERTAAAVAALQQATADSARAMSTLKDSSGHLLAAVREGHAAQQQTQRLAVELQTGLGALQAGQTQALARLQVSTTALHTKAEDAGRSLVELQGALAATGAEAANQLHALHDLAVEHYDALEQRTSGLLHVLGRVEQVQATLAERSFTTREVVKFAGAGLAVLIGTMPQRTAAARLPAVAVVLAGWLAPLLLQPVLHRALPWFALSLGTATGLVLLGARAYRPPGNLQRQMLREELLEALGRFTETNAPHHGASLFPSRWPRDNGGAVAVAPAWGEEWRSLAGGAASQTPLPIHHEGDPSEEEEEEEAQIAGAASVRGRRRMSKGAVPPASAAKPRRAANEARSSSRSGGKKTGGRAVRSQSRQTRARK